MIKKRLQNFFTLFDRVMPYGLKIIPYKFAIACTRIFFSLFLKKSLIGMWPRNSYTSHNIIFAKSDLDLTLFLSDLNSSKNIKRLVIIIKKIIWVIGEFNIYHKSDYLMFSEIANSYELKRDPFLLNYISNKNNNCEYSEFVFYLRQYRSDYQNLIKNPQSRFKKWEQFISAEELNSHSLLSKILGLLNKQKSEVLEQKIEEVINWQYRDPYCLNYDYDIHFMILFSDLWLGVSIVNNQLSQDMDILSSCSNIEFLNTLSYQLDWELFGMYHQHILIDDWEHLKLRLQAIKSVYQLLNNKEILSQEKLQHRVELVDVLLKRLS